MYKEVLYNLLESIYKPQIFNTDEENLQYYFNSGNQIYFVHGECQLKEVSSFINKLILENGITFDFYGGDHIWINLKGAISVNDVSKLMFSSNNIFAESHISATYDTSREGIEVSIIISIASKHREH